MINTVLISVGKMHVMCSCSLIRLKYYYTGSAIAFMAVLLVVVIVVIAYAKKKLLQRVVPDPKVYTSLHGMLFTGN